MTRFWPLSVFLLAPLCGGAALAAEPTSGSERQWPSAPLRGVLPELPPCTCRSPAGDVALGQEACLAERRAVCIMVENNTSWSFKDEPCGPRQLTN